MITRYDRIATSLPEPQAPNPNAASVVQELLGGKFGEMSTLMNYTFQSFNFRGRERRSCRPFYDLIANIAAEEFGHIEVVTYTINLLLTGATKRGTDPSATPLAGDGECPQFATTSSPAASRPCRSTRWATPGPGRTSSPAAT